MLLLHSDFEPFIALNRCESTWMGTSLLESHGIKIKILANLRTNIKTLFNYYYYYSIYVNDSVVMVAEVMGKRYYMYNIYPQFVFNRSCYQIINLYSIFVWNKIIKKRFYSWICQIIHSFIHSFIHMNQVLQHKFHVPFLSR